MNMKKEEVNLSVDDLILEIGKLHVEKMGLDKKIEILSKNLEESHISKDIYDRTVKSNEEYKKNNKEMSDSLVVIHKENSKMKAENESLINELEYKDKEIETLAAKSLKLTKKKPVIKK